MPLGPSAYISSLRGGNRVSIKGLYKFQIIPDSLCCNIQFIRFLQIHPQTWASVKEYSQAKGGIGSHAAALVDDFIKTVFGNTNPYRQCSGRHANRLQLVGQNFSWMNGFC